MSIVIGIDVGGSTTKIVGFNGKTLLTPLSVKANSPEASAYGAFGAFISDNNIALSDISEVSMTGVGSTAVKLPMFGIKTKIASEFEAIGCGGVYLTGVKPAIIASVGTGTALVYCNENGKNIYIGGTGVGGGTLIGLSRRMLGMNDVEQIIELAEQGDLANIDLRLMDMSSKTIIPTLPGEMTASNFGNLNDMASNADIAMGILNMIYETVAMMAIFSGRTYNCNNIIVVGRLATTGLAKKVYSSLAKPFGVDVIIPDNAEYATAIGTALQAANTN